MRKRKLYVSELIKRCKNYEYRVCIKTRTAYHYYENIDDTLKCDSHLNEQVITWYIKETEPPQITINTCEEVETSIRL